MVPLFFSGDGSVVKDFISFSSSSGGRRVSKELLLEAEWKGEQALSAMDKKKLKRPARGETPSGAGKKAERGKNGWVCRRHCWVRLKKEPGGGAEEIGSVGRSCCCWRTSLMAWS